MRSPILFLSVLFLLSFAACKGAKPAGEQNQTSVKSGEVAFINSETLSDVLDEAERQDKLVFVDFYTTWCLPCRLMDEEVFNDKEIAKFLNDNFLSYKVDAERGNGPNLAVVFNVNTYPTLLFLDAKGRVLEKKVGAAFQTELREMGQRALSQGGQ
ncbi:MAG: thioredoxin family protein [Bacteroidota bacterium]